MKYKKMGLTATFGILLCVLAHGGLVNADEDENDDEEYEEKYEYDDDYEDEDHDYEDEDDDNYYNYQSNSITTMNTWNIWTSTTLIHKGELPFNETKRVHVKLENESNVMSLFIIPLDGELFVPGQTVAEILGAETKLYNTSKILEVTTRNKELIFRAGTNVVYDNKVKSPIPAAAFYMNDQVYIPISVITNGLGYVAEWEKESNTVVIKPLQM